MDIPKPKFGTWDYVKYVLSTFKPVMKDVVEYEVRMIEEEYASNGEML